MFWLYGTRRNGKGVVVRTLEYILGKQMRFILRLFYLPIFILFICTVMCLCTKTYSSNHFVDRTAKGNNSGSSWTNAWESFSAIDWNQIQPGDTLFISGGTDSLEYNERLKIKASGTYGKLVVIRPGLDAGHNGRVIFVNLTSSAVTTDDGIDYIRIEKLEMRKRSPYCKPFRINLE